MPPGSCAASLALALLAAPLAGQGPQGKPEQKTRSWSDLLTENLAPFHKNYLMPLSYDPDLGELPSTESDGDNKDAEVKFQFSLRYTLTDPHPNVPGQLYFAYTALSHWQLYDTEGSSPFRTTDHEPELFWEWSTNARLGTRAGISHQSNGEGGAESRSWNRVYAEALWNGVDRWDERRPNEWGVALKAWHAFEVSGNNDDITDYMGNFELRMDWVMPWDARHVQLLSVLVRRDFDEGRGALEIDYSRDFLGRSRLLFQYFTGYGESLLDYNEYAERFSVGFEFSP